MRKKIGSFVFLILVGLFCALIIVSAKRESWLRVETAKGDFVKKAEASYQKWTESNAIRMAGEVSAENNAANTEGETFGNEVDYSTENSAMNEIVGGDIVFYSDLIGKFSDYPLISSEFEVAGNEVLIGMSVDVYTAEGHKVGFIKGGTKIRLIEPKTGNGLCRVENVSDVGYEYVYVKENELQICTREPVNEELYDEPKQALEHNYVENIGEYCGNINDITAILSNGMVSKRGLGISASQVTFSSSAFEVKHGAVVSAQYGFSYSGTLPTSFTGTGNAEMQFTVYKYNDELAKYEVYNNTIINMGSKTDTDTHSWSKVLESGKYYVYWSGYNNNIKYYFSSILVDMRIRTY